MTRPGRAADASSIVPDPYSVDPSSLVARLSRLSMHGLQQMYDPRSKSFPRRVRARSRTLAPVREGLDVRYTSVAALGLSRVDRAAREQVLAGHDLEDLLPGILGLALAGRDPGALALALWAAGEIAAEDPAAVPTESERTARCLERLVAIIRTETPEPAVEHAWTLSALVGAAAIPELADVVPGGDQLPGAARRAARRLVDAQGSSGLFPHHLPPDRLNRFRYHVGCFADQAYAIQALTRYAVWAGDDDALAAAARCADRLVALQGADGQWWWHYDWRYGTVVETYPVYSVHQYALAPMALFELEDAGGPDHRGAVAAGLAWLLDRPESAGELIDDDAGVVWRTVGRREPRKFVRKIRSAATARHPDRRLTWLDPVFPPGPVDHECRPFELGWMLYAWHARQPLARSRSATEPTEIALPRSRQVAEELA